LPVEGRHLGGDVLLDLPVGHRGSRVDHVLEFPELWDLPREARDVGRQVRDKVHALLAVLQQVGDVGDLLALPAELQRA
jgi:hypothetical protein